MKRIELLRKTGICITAFALSAAISAANPMMMTAFASDATQAAAESSGGDDGGGDSGGGSGSESGSESGGESGEAEANQEANPAVKAEANRVESPEESPEANPAAKAAANPAAKAAVNPAVKAAAPDQQILPPATAAAADPDRAVPSRPRKILRSRAIPVPDSLTPRTLQAQIHPAIRHQAIPVPAIQIQHLRILLRMLPHRLPLQRPQLRQRLLLQIPSRISPDRPVLPPVPQASTKIRERL